MILTLFSLILSLLTTSSDPPYALIKQQTEQYLQNIEEQRQVAENFWALNELFTSNCSVNTIVEYSINSNGNKNIVDLFNRYPCSDLEESNAGNSTKRLQSFALSNKSLEIAVAVLSSSESSIEKNQFLTEFKSFSSDSLIIEFLNKLVYQSNIDVDNTLLSDSFTLYQLLYSDFVNNYFTTEDLLFLSNDLKKRINSDTYSFNSTLIHYSFFKTVYEINRFDQLPSIFNYLIIEQFYPNSRKKVSILGGIDYGLGIIGSYAESLQLQDEKLLPLTSYYNLKSRTEYTLLQKGSILYELGKYKSSQVILEELYNDPSSSIPKSQLYTNLSLTYQKLGEQNKYAQFLLDAVKSLEELDENKYGYLPVKLGLYRNLFVYYNTVKDSSSALIYINKAKEIAKEQNNNSELGSIYYYLGDFYWTNYRDANKALAEFKKAENIFFETDNYRRQMLLLFDKTDILIEIDSLEAADSLNQKTKELALTNADTPRLVRTLIHQGEIALKKNDIIALENTLKEIRIYPLTDLEFEILIRYHNLYAGFLLKQSLYREAYTYFKPILEQVIDRAKGSVNEQSGFWTVDKEYLDAFENMITILHHLKDYHKSLAYLDQLKTINDASLYNNPLVKANKLNEQELATDKKLGAQIQRLRNQYLSVKQESKPSIKAEIDRLSSIRQTLTNKVNQNFEANYLPIWKVQQQIKNDEMVLHFTQVNKQLLVYRITNKTIEPTILDLDEEQQKFLNTTANLLANANTSLTKLFKLYNFLDLKSIPKSINHISVIPDGELYRIPLEVLPTAKPNSDFSFGSSKFMVEDYSFKYFTSLRDYSENNRLVSNNLSTDFSIFAISNFNDFKQKQLSSLPYAIKEAEKIDQKLTSLNTKKVYAGENATTTSFKKQLNNSKIIHVATHSEVSEDDPLFSTIYLKSPDSEGNTFKPFYAYQLFDYSLDNELVMLNSCSSGSGNYMQGTGIMGISRALRYAGAKSLALNLWEVNDKIASDFAEHFYSFINEGYSKSEAMRQAKIKLIQIGSADPHYWAAYSLIGNSSPIIKKPASSYIMMPLLLAISLLVGYRIRKTTI